MLQLMLADAGWSALTLTHSDDSGHGGEGEQAPGPDGEAQELGGEVAAPGGRRCPVLQPGLRVPPNVEVSAEMQFEH